MSPALALLSVVVAAPLLTLEQAVHSAIENQPALRQAGAQTDAARARATQALAAFTPQLSGSAQYQRTTLNGIPNPGALTAAAAPSGHTSDLFNFRLGASQLLFDYQSLERFRSSKVGAEAQAQTERGQKLAVVLAVQTAYFSARAQRALLNVARETLSNQQRHLDQIEGFVSVGTRPEIDRAQARTDRANARVALINAENNYEVAKAQLNQTMGIEGPTDYDVADQSLPPVAGEEQPTEALLVEAQKSRPELAAAEETVRSQELLVRSLYGGYLPSLTTALNLTSGGYQIDHLGWNWNASLNLGWQSFAPVQVRAQIAEARANLIGLEAARDLTRQQIRLELDQARLAVRAANAALGAADEALENARERLRLAEGRYQIGVGSPIELGDSQVALTSAAAQRVQADYNLASARAQLLKALGRP